MMNTKASPDWLIPAFCRAVVGAGSPSERVEIEFAGEALLRRWEDSERKYHNVWHLVDLLQHLGELSKETHRPHAVVLAAWYHGAVFAADEATAYSGRGGEDEEASAEFAREQLTALEVPEPMVESVVAMIHALGHHAPKFENSDCAILCDADLAILAASPQRYKEYTDGVREEYSHIPLQDYLTSRHKILTKLLKRGKLFLSPNGALWESAARQNITAELHRISQEIACCDEAAEATSTDVPS